MTKKQLCIVVGLPVLFSTGLCALLCVIGSKKVGRERDGLHEFLNARFEAVTDRLDSLGNRVDQLPQ